MATSLSLSSPSTSLALNPAPRLVHPPLQYFSSCSSTLRIFPLKRFRQDMTSVRSKPLFLRVQSLDFETSLRTGEADKEGNGGAEDEFVDDDDEEPPPLFPELMIGDEEKEMPPCPPGLLRYETMAILRPDMSEDERLAFTQRYEELLVAGGGMYVEVFNRGVIPLSYSIKKKNKEGETNTYLDGIYLLFTYFTKPESVGSLETAMRSDDDVIRSVNFKVRKRKY